MRLHQYPATNNSTVVVGLIAACTAKGPCTSMRFTEELYVFLLETARSASVEVIGKALWAGE
jgi:hypothetical protein